MFYVGSCAIEICRRLYSQPCEKLGDGIQQRSVETSQEYASIQTG